MRKVLAIFTVVLLIAVGFATRVQAEGEIELFPSEILSMTLESARLS